MDLLDPLLRGAAQSVFLTLVAIPVAVIVAFVFGLLRLSSVWLLRTISTVFVEIFRGTSLLVQLFLLFYFLPFLGLRLPPIETGVIVLGLHFGAYGSEVVRSSIRAVDVGQRDAAIALNMSKQVAMRRVILPQAIVTMLPPFANSSIELLKATSLTSLITIKELSATGQVLIDNAPRRTPEVLLLVLVFYFALAFPLSRLVRALETRRQKGLSIGRPQP